MTELPARHAFSSQDYRARVEAVRARMRDRGITVLCLTSPENMFYLTGYDAWSFYTHQMAILHVSQGDPLWVGRQIDVPCAQATCWIPAENMVGYGDGYVDSAERHAMEFIADIVNQYGWGSEAIGFEYENYYFTARAFLTLQSALPDAQFCDATNLVNWVRSVKSPAEITYMRQAARIADATMDAGVQAIQPGALESNVAAVFNGAQTKGVEGLGGDPQAEVIVISTGDEVTCPHLAWTDRPLPKMGPINVELSGVRKRYTAALSRSIYLGKAPDSITGLADATLDALALTIEAIKPGIEARDVWIAYNDALAKYGEHKPSRVGYSIGIGYTPSWIERTISFGPEDTTILKPNMTFHLMCGMWRENDGFVQSQTLRVTDTGCEDLNHYPKGLIVIN